MAEKKYQLGTMEASEQLIKDLYINLRTEVNAWAKVTCQTPQARMGYIGQHLVSVVTGYPGGKSGARGYDLIMGNNTYGEIKTCYRVDQLGQCSDCGSVVSSLEKQCSACGSDSIIKKEDSKWLITIRHDTEFCKILEPERYYFVLFEFESISTIDNNNIVASIWEVDPKTKGFGYCMMDYYLNIRAKCNSKAPFNMWPHQFKFALTQPKLIYRSVIKEDGTIDTKIFPTKGNSYIDELLPLSEYSRTTTITLDVAKKVLLTFDPHQPIEKKSKHDLLTRLETMRQTKPIRNNRLCDMFADAIYLPLLESKISEIPDCLRRYYKELQ